jgi:hypothetical protein
MTADVTLDHQHESVQPGVSLFAFLSLFRNCPSDVGNLPVVTFGVVSKTMSASRKTPVNPTTPLSGDRPDPTVQ